MGVMNCISYKGTAIGQFLRDDGVLALCLQHDVVVTVV